MSLLFEPKTIIDAGANTGQTVEGLRAWWPRANVYCIEPTRAAFEALERKWGKKADIHLYRAALADQAGRGVVHTGENTAVSSLLPHVGDYSGTFDIHQQDEVDLITIDGLMESAGLERVDLLKMDLQGGELSALRGAEEGLRREAFDVIFSEIWLTSPYQDCPRYWEIAQYLEEFGYVTWWLNIEPSPHGNTEGRWGDAVFVGRRLARSLGYEK
jgi:FkbM family methyltransferase